MQQCQALAWLVFRLALRGGGGSCPVQSSFLEAPPPDILPAPQLACGHVYTLTLPGITRLFMPTLGGAAAGEVARCLPARLEGAASAGQSRLPAAPAPRRPLRKDSGVGGAKGAPLNSPVAAARCSLAASARKALLGGRAEELTAPAGSRGVARSGCPESAAGASPLCRAAPRRAG